MKLLLVAVGIIVIGLSAFRPFEDKKLKVEYTQKEWETRFAWINYVKSRLSQSDLPAKEVSFINDSLLTKFQVEISQQLQPQMVIDSTNKKPKK
jgi:hypothetical protein